MPLDRSLIAARLAAHPPRSSVAGLISGRRAAVAALLRFDRARPEVLLIQRAEHPGDRWSGHVAMPGGRADEGDVDLLATAVRETREEVGVDLERTARLLGRLDEIPAIAKGRILPMTITPFVFERVEESPVVLNREATDHFWLPLDLAAGGSLDDIYEYRLGPLPLRLPCWRWEGRVVWGLTYQMLSSLIAVVRE